MDERDHVRLGGYPGAFRELLGAWCEEFHPVGEGERVQLDDGGGASLWTEHLHVATAEVVASYVDGPLPGIPAITRNVHGAGAAWYVATRLDRGAVDRLAHRVLDEAGVDAVVATDGNLEAVRRRADDDTTYLVLVNHGDRDVEVTVTGRDVVGGTMADGSVTVPGGQVRVIAEH